MELISKAYFINKSGSLRSALIFLLFICNYEANSQRKQMSIEHAYLAFDIDGGLSLNGKEVGDFAYCLHANGKILDSAYVKRSRPFIVKLEPNETYTMSFHKEGFLDRYIVINTNIHEKDISDDFYMLSFEIELNPEHSMKKERYIDHPVAVIKYHHKSKTFDFSNKYHNEIHHVTRHVIVNE